MTGQDKTNHFLTKFLAGLEKTGSYLCSVEGTPYQYIKGVWRIVDDKAAAKLKSAMYKAGDAYEYDYINKERVTWSAIWHRTALEDTRMDEKLLTVCPNGTFNLRTGEAYANAPANYTTRQIITRFDPKAKCPEWEKMLHRIFADLPEDQINEHITFLQEFFGMAVIGYDATAVVPRGLRKGLILHGPASTGKTTIANVLKTLIGSGHVASPTLKQLSSQFGKASLLNARALITDDAITKTMAPDPLTLKHIVTGETMQVEQKFEKAVQFNYQGAVVFTTNELPRINDETNSVYSRYVIVTTTRVFDPAQAKVDFPPHGDPVKYLLEKGEMAGVLNWAVEGYKRAIERGSLSVPAACMSASEAARRENDGVYEFLKECTEYDPKVATSVKVARAAAAQYVSAVHSGQKNSRLSLSEAGARIKRAAPTIMPGVEVDKSVALSSGDTYRCMKGLRLSADGADYAKAAVEAGLLKQEDLRVMNARI